MIDLRNTNTIWASVLVGTLSRLGLRTAILCPGSRSTPLTVAFASHSNIESLAILDERSAAFFALGIAKKTGVPVVLVCTSGTASANFFPAIIEARESRIPLLILTADRPAELRDCHSGQTIDQLKLYGNYVNWFAEVSPPILELGQLKYLRQLIIQGWQRCLWPVAGPVHFNCPFRDPLPPLPQSEAANFSQEFPSDFLLSVHPITLPKIRPSLEILENWKLWQSCDKGLIIAGVDSVLEPDHYCQAIGQLSQGLGWPVLAEGLSPVRNYFDFNSNLISTYDLLLRNQEIAENLKPEMVIQIGDLPTSKQLREWLTEINPRRWIFTPGHDNLDPLHGQTIHLYCPVEEFIKSLEETPPNLPLLREGIANGENQFQYLKLWLEFEGKVRDNLDQKMAEIEEIIEPKVAWILSQSLPPETPLFIANSMPVRDVEFFWKPNHQKIKPFFNRGANGIDGTLSTALGISHQSQNSVLLTGDLALLHDTNGFLFSSKLQGSLTIILINNQGGGIFEMLPISQFNPPFEEFFATPQQVNFATLCQTYGIEYESITTWSGLQEKLNRVPGQGIRVLEILTDRKRDAQWRQENLPKFSQIN